MQRLSGSAAMLAFVGLSAWSPPAHGAVFVSSPSPVVRIVSLLTDLKARVEADGKLEQASYDKYACWCEDALSAKAADISAGKGGIESLQTLITKLKGELGVHGAEIKQLKKDIDANVESQREATEIRDKEEASFTAQKTESEQCIGALEAAIRVLTHAGTGKTRFLETLQEAQLLSVAAGIRAVLSRPDASRAMSSADFGVVRRFADRPEDFVGSHADGDFLSAAQIANNPFGDYAPQSTRIQGILKSLHETFTADLERAKAEESVKAKSFEELMSTKRNELKTLQDTLKRSEMDEAEKTKTLADSRTSLDSTKAQLAADEAFFTETKSACKAKAGEWAQRTRLRTEELHGMARALEILSSPEAMKTFHNASTTFVQISSRSSGRGVSSAAQSKAYSSLRVLATRYKSLGLAKIAVMLKSTGHFDKVIAAIETMIKVLREEEQDDIAHRDRCQGSLTQNKYTREDLNYTIEKARKEIARTQDDAAKVAVKITSIEADINATRADIADLLQMRGAEHAAFLQAITDDASAIALLDQAIVVLTEFYRSNGMPLSLAQNDTAPPEVIWQTGKYGGRKTESEGVIAILSLIKEDLEKETQVARVEDAEAQKLYESDSKAMRDMLKAQGASHVAANSELADMQKKIVDLQEYEGIKGSDLNAAGKTRDALEFDCAWVDTHFESRRTKRKAEMDGLVEAKNYLAGVESGDELP